MKNFVAYDVYASGPVAMARYKMSRGAHGPSVCGKPSSEQVIASSKKLMQKWKDCSAEASGSSAAGASASSSRAAVASASRGVDSASGAGSADSPSVSLIQSASQKQKKPISTARFADALLKLAEFYDDHGRPPRRSKHKSSESALARFLNDLRSKSMLSPSQQEQMTITIPWAIKAPKAYTKFKPPQAWLDALLVKLKSFHDEKGRVPRMSKLASSDEKELASQLQSLRAARSNLSETELAAVKSMTPFALERIHLSGTEKTDNRPLISLAKRKLASSLSSSYAGWKVSSSSSSLLPRLRLYKKTPVPKTWVACKS